MNSPFSRPNWAEIDLGALRHNARTLAAHASGARLLAVVKADAYGHGALSVAQALRDEPSVAFLGVASVDEGARLRAAGVHTPILLLSAILPSEAAEVVHQHLTPTVYTLDVGRALDEAARNSGRVLDVHFKVDTGMGRLGVTWCEATERLGAIRMLPNLAVRGVYTHFACADEEDNPLTPLQLARFHEFLASVELPPGCLQHAANSAATLRFPASHFDLVRPGLALYGAHPCRALGPDLDLRPVMTWKARVSSVKTVAAGESVSYGATWRAPRSSRIAVLPCGYADGYLRALSNRGQVSVNGARAPVVGRVTMDQILLDVTDVEGGVRVGDEAILWGRDPHVEAVADLAATVSYELLCAVAARVPRIVIDP